MAHAEAIRWKGWRCCWSLPDCELSLGWSSATICGG